MPNPLRAVLYLRVSSKAQEKAGTIASQKRDVRSIAEREGWTILREYVDDGASAATGNMAARPGLLAMLAAAEAREFDVVAVYDIDRLSRADLLERSVILGTLQRAGVHVASVVGGMMDLGSIAGEITAMVSARAAQDWLEKHRERVKAGKLTAISRGWKPSGPTPYGYRYDRASHAWSVDDGAAAIVREISCRVARHESCYAIAADLARRGAPTIRGGAWSRERVWQIARSETYLGRWVAHRARRLSIAVPRILSDEEHAAARTALARHHRRGARRTRHVYLIDDLATCGRCGAPIGIASAVTPRSPAPRGRPGPRLPLPSRYVCTHRRRPDGERCLLPYHDTATIDAALWDAISDVLAEPRLVERALRKMRAADAAAPDPRLELERARGEIARIDRAEATLVERVTAITPAALDAALAKLATARATARIALAAAERAAAGSHLSIAATADLEAGLAALRDYLPTLDATARRRWVRRLVSEAQIGDTTAWVALHLPADLLGLVSGSG